MAWLSGYNHRRSVTISRSSGAVTDYQIKFLVGENTGGSVSCNQKCASDFRDIRFTASDGTTVLPYWIESVSGTSPDQVATVWVKFNTIGATSTTFYMYYGNTEASSASSGTSTFLSFDDDSVLVSGDVALVWTGVISSTNSVEEGVKLVSSDGAQYLHLKKRVGIGTEYVSKGTAGPYTISFSTAQIPQNVSHIFEVVRIASGSNRILMDGATIYTGSIAGATPLVPVKAQFVAGVKTSPLLVRKYLSTQPVVGAWGAEEDSGYAFVMSGGIVSSGALETTSGYWISGSGDIVIAGSIKQPMALNGPAPVVVGSLSDIKKQINFACNETEPVIFDLVDASINFKLEQQP